jgi:uncharacterized membrane protein YfcA
MIDNGLGGGFGTIMTPLLIILGYDPKIIVPAILVSETVSGVWGGYCHLRLKNVNFKAVGITLLGSIIAMISASFIIGVLLPSIIVKWYASILAFFMGIFVVYKSYRKIRARDPDDFSKWKCTLLGGIIGFNKGSTGGGYGPLSVSGYILLGLPAAIAIGTTTVAEGIACAMGVVIYGSTIGIALSMAMPIAIGSAVADPISAWINNTLKKRVDPPFHGRLVGVAMTVLGLITIFRLLNLI